MWCIKEIMKAGVCSFCETVYEYESLNKIEFLEGFINFINEIDLDYCLESNTQDITYDTNLITNLCKNLYKDIKFNDITKITELMGIAFDTTIFKDSTINVEAFTENSFKVLKD